MLSPECPGPLEVLPVPLVKEVLHIPPGNHPHCKHAQPSPHYMVEAIPPGQSELVTTASTMTSFFAH